MLRRSRLKDVLHSGSLTRKQQVLLCLAVDQDTPKSVSDVRTLGEVGGLRGVKKWNLSLLLGSLRGAAVRTSSGWELTDAGKAQVRTLLGMNNPAHAVAVSNLRHALPDVASPQARAFAEEAIGCAEAKFHRAAVVLSWVGALGVLYDHVVEQHLSPFNVEATRRDAKWRIAKTPDDLARMKEHDFLQVLEAVSVIGKSVKAELETCLKLRNGCGHPNSLQMSESRVASHIEILVLNVFSVFS